MVGCTIPFCNNSLKKGYVMKIIPKDTERRMNWLKSINGKYKNWTPSKNSSVCEMHFAPKMWEQRMDNKKKLKLNAVPTIFGYFVKKKVPFNNQNFDVVEDKCRFISDDCKEDQIIIPINETIEVNASIINPNTSTKCTSSITEIDGKKEKDKNKKLEEINRKMQIHLTLMCKKMRILRSRILRLETKNNNDQYKKLLTKKRKTNWLNETVQRALRLRLLVVLMHVYDSSTKTRKYNIPNKEDATHALTLMLTGTANQWKHIVDYFYTGDSFDGAVLKDIILQIIYKAEIIGLHVNYITSDMNPGNDKLWKCCGINMGRYSDIRNCISHPSDPNRFLYFIADVF
ncbi:THAP4 protein, partial [Acromyrmex insinuator]